MQAQSQNRKKLLHFLTISLCMLLFGTVSLFGHVKELKGVDYLGSEQLARHRALIENRAPGPRQYRVLTAYLIEGLDAFLDVIGLREIHITVLDKRRYLETTGISFLLLRFMIDTSLFTLAFVYYKTIGIRFYTALFGLSLLALSIAQSGFNSDLAFDTYLEGVFFLLAALAILGDRPFWIVPITLIAALNRETSVLIPLTLLAAAMAMPPEQLARKRAIFVAVVALILFSVVFVSLRTAFGIDPVSAEEKLSEATDGLFLLGPIVRFLSDIANVAISGISYNLSSPLTYLQLAVTFGVLPILAWVSRSWWPDSLKVFVAIVPIWMLVHLLFGRLEETRLLMVPHVLVVIPGALFGLASDADSSFRRESSAIRQQVVS